jgi:5-methylcytosine-specific restriction endonuclease McrA
MVVPKKKRPDLEKPYNNGTWTEGRFNSFVKSALRSASQRWPPKYKALNESKQGKRINPSSGRLAEYYRCASCKADFPAKGVQVDHIIPVINPAVGFTSWDDAIKRMFCEQKDFQILCSACHKEKTNLEKQQSIERIKTINANK